MRFGKENYVTQQRTRGYFLHINKTLKLRVTLLIKRIHRKHIIKNKEVN